MYVHVYPPGIRKAKLRLAKVGKVYADTKINICSEEVLIRPRDKRTNSDIRSKAKDLEPMKVPVQRTVLTMPKSEVNTVILSNTILIIPSDKIEYGESVNYLAYLTDIWSDQRP